MKRITLAILLIGLCAGCTSYNTQEVKQIVGAEPEQKLYLAYNLHHRGRAARAANYQYGIITPFGTEVEVNVPFFSRSGVHQVKIIETGETINCRYNSKYNEPTIDEHLKRMLTTKDFKEQSKIYSKQQIDIILAGMVVKGMTKKDVILTCGYPPSHRTFSLKNNTWCYWNSKFGTFPVVFNRNGIVIKGKPTDNNTTRAFWTGVIVGGLIRR
ncbi:MAG: hypothetical protein L3J71_02535 [Victivallaceae bacterium]|nr:hypothetical protein [Victivallaceae bacterium]